MIDKDKYINYLIKENCLLIEKINKAIESIKLFRNLFNEDNLLNAHLDNLLEILGDNEDD